MNIEDIRRPDDMVRITTPELAQAFIDEQIALVKEQVGDKKVLLALSGGVDSSVVAALLIKAIGDQLVCVHVNHGLLRKGEPEQVIQVFRNEMKAKIVSWTSWQASPTRRPRERSSAVNSSKSSPRKQESSTASSSWPRAPSGRTSWRAKPASRPTTTRAACRRI